MSKDKLLSLIFSFMAESSKKPFPYKTKYLEETRKEIVSTEYTRWESVTKRVTKVEDGSTKDKPVYLFIQQQNKFVAGYGYQNLEKVTEIDVDSMNALLEKTKGR